MGAGVLKFYKESTAVAGAISFNTEDLRGEVGRIYVNPATSSTTYDITITDDNSLSIYSKKGLRGTLNDISRFFAKGIHTVAITNASTNELFKFLIEWEERVG